MLRLVLVSESKLHNFFYEHLDLIYYFFVFIQQNVVEIQYLKLDIH